MEKLLLVLLFGLSNAVLLVKWGTPCGNKTGGNTAACGTVANSNYFWCGVPPGMAPTSPNVCYCPLGSPGGNTLCCNPLDINANAWCSRQALPTVPNSQFLCNQDVPGSGYCISDNTTAAGQYYGRCARYQATNDGTPPGCPLSGDEAQIKSGSSTSNSSMIPTELAIPLFFVSFFFGIVLSYVVYKVRKPRAQEITHAPKEIGHLVESQSNPSPAETNVEIATHIQQC